MLNSSAKINRFLKHAHPLFVPAYFVITQANEYFGLLSATLLLKYLAIYSILALLIYLAGKFMFKNSDKALVWTNIFLVIFFFFGAAYDVVKTTSWLEPLIHYKVVLVFLSVSLIIGTVWLARTRRKLTSLTFIASRFWLLLLLISVVIFTGKSISNDPAATNVFPASDFNKVQDRRSSSNPDIFFIVFDEYASNLSLERHYHFNNGELDSLLSNHRFYIARNSKSNYNTSPLSVASTLNGNYSFLDLQGKTSNSYLWLKAWSSLKHSAVPQALSRMGYQIHNFSVADLHGYPAAGSTFYKQTEVSILFDQTLAGRISRDILWNLAETNVPFASEMFRNLIRDSETAYIDRNSSNIQKFMEQLNKEESRPRFVYAHILLPHPPYYLDENGNRRESASTTSHTDRDIKQYLDQVRYCNKIISRIAEINHQVFSRERALIVAGDHGFRWEGPAAVPEMQFMNLNTIYFSNGKYDQLYDSISPVNTFRVLFNNYFDAQLPLINDSSILYK